MSFDIDENFEEEVEIQAAKRIDDIKNPIIPEKVSARTPTNNNIIDARGMGQTVLKWKSSGLSYHDIALRLSITPQVVSAWFRQYHQLDEDQQLAVHKRSVFDVANRLEETFTEVIRLLDEAKEAFDRESSIKLVAEMRACQKFALEVLAATKQAQDIERWKEAVMSVFDELTPGSRQEIAKRLMQDRQTSALFKGF